MEREGLPAAAATSTQHAAAMGRVTWHCCVWALATLGARLALARRPYGDALRAVGSMHAVVALMNVLAAGSSVALLVAAFAGDGAAMAGTHTGRATPAQLHSLVPSAAFYTVAAVSHSLDTGSGSSSSTEEAFLRLGAALALVAGVTTGAHGAQLLLLLLLLEAPHAPMHLGAACARAARRDGGGAATAVAQLCERVFWPTFVACRFVVTPALALVLLRRAGSVSSWISAPPPWAAWAAAGLAAISALTARRAKRGLWTLTVAEGDGSLHKLGAAAAQSAEAQQQQRQSAQRGDDGSGNWGERPRAEGAAPPKPMSFKDWLAREKAEREKAKEAVKKAGKPPRPPPKPSDKRT